MAGGKSPKLKGDRGEREFKALMGGDRTFWQPGQEETQGDLVNVPYIGKGEVKRRKNDFKRLYDWIEGNDFVAVRADRKGWLVCIRAEDLKRLTEEMDGLKRLMLNTAGYSATRAEDAV